jgi:hypothetical protein
MRIIFCLLLMLPFFAKAQINRSANELAHENIKTYISTKVFKGHHYKPVAYGELQSNKQYNNEAVWVLDHRFEIEQTLKEPAKDFENVQQPYRFIFYLDKKMKVVRAEAIKF